MDFVVPQRLKPGDKVAIVSPSAGMAHAFPWVYELGLERLREFGLEPVEFPTARKDGVYLQKNPEARAEDINVAFADTSIKGIIATIGGFDQIRILPYLDSDVISANPKIFMGFSDNTNLHLYLWNLGIVSYYGGHLMNQFAMQGGMHPFTIEYLKRALFEPSIGEIDVADETTDYDLPWDDPHNLKKIRPMEKSDGWVWLHEKNRVVDGKLWGGCLEILDLQLAVRLYLPEPKELEGSILYLETSEEMPTEGFVYRFLAALGELNVLQRLKALLIGRPKTQFCNILAPGGREAYAHRQQDAIKKALLDYECNPLVVFNMNFGHTDPQIIIPNGANASIDGMKRTIKFN